MISTVFDIAGGRQGGAARFLAEFDAYSSANHIPGLSVIGRRHKLTPRWLAEREARTMDIPNKIAVNNASFYTGERRVVLLRNALHFSSDDEFRSLGFHPSPTFRAQVPIIRLLARRATTLVVPCNAMAERVVHVAPTLAPKIEVRFHPVTLPSVPPSPLQDSILVPIINTPYKELDTHIARLLATLARAGNRSTRVLITDIQESFPREVAEDPRVTFIGKMPHTELWKHWTAARAIYYPTKVEAFGYPLAEARASGKPIICQQVEQNIEIAGSAYVGFNQNDPASLEHAVDVALRSEPTADLHPFDRDRYFEWLLALATA